VGLSLLELVTTTFVLPERGSAAARRPYRTAVSRLRDQMEESNRLIAPTDADRQSWRDRRGPNPNPFFARIRFAP
jgi:hypothetical protein